MASSLLDGMASGQLEGTGTALEVKLPFTPRVVELINVDGDVRLEWDHTMVEGGGFKIVMGTSYALITTGGVTPMELNELEDYSSGSAWRGFKIGTDSDVNASGETIHYRAWA